MRNRRRGGFTLIELMIVVVIVGALAAIAIPSFVSYVYRSRTTEATTFLGEIRQRQESYRAEFGTYAAVGATLTPDEDPGRAARAWVGPAEWVQLGARPDGQVRFSYRGTSGAPSTQPEIGGTNVGAANYPDFWFVAQAVGDLDGDDDNVIFETYSAGNHIYCDESKGWE